MLVYTSIFNNQIARPKRGLGVVGVARPKRGLGVVGVRVLALNL